MLPTAVPLIGVQVLYKLKLGHTAAMEFSQILAKEFLDTSLHYQTGLRPSPRG